MAARRGMLPDDSGPVVRRWPSPSTRCANRGGRAPTATPTPALPPSTQDCASRWAGSAAAMQSPARIAGNSHGFQLGCLENVDITAHRIVNDRLKIISTRNPASTPSGRDAMRERWTALHGAVNNRGTIIWYNRPASTWMHASHLRTSPAFPVMYSRYHQRYRVNWKGE